MISLKFSEISGNVNFQSSLDSKMLDISLLPLSHQRKFYRIKGEDGSAPRVENS